jgi:hypothetical protein
MPAQEVLGARDNMSQHDGSAEWVQNVLVVGVEHQTFRYTALEADNSG